MTENKHTPGPWEIGRGGEVYAATQYQSVAMVCLHDEGEANARLIASAPDHALIGWAMCIAAGRWEPLGDMSGEFCINGIRHLTRLDEFGCPAMTAGMRAAILKAQGASS